MLKNNGAGVPINASMGSGIKWGTAIWCNPNLNENMDIRAYTENSNFTNSIINLILEYTKIND